MKKYLVLALLLACVQMPCLASPPRDTLISQGPVQITSVVWTSYGNVIVEYRVGAHILSCIGFGPSCQWQQWTGRNYTNFAITLAALFFPNAEETPFPWDMGAGLLLTAFNGYGIGIGYNAGLVPGKSINRLI